MPKNLFFTNFAPSTTKIIILLIVKSVQYIHKFKAVATALLITLCLSIWANSTFYTHTHNLQSGSITHAHPYSTPHTHSTDDLLAIDAATVNTALEIDTENVNITPPQYFSNLYHNTTTSKTLATFVGFNKALRAPPVSL